MSKDYPINQSRLFKQSNKRKLAELLKVSKEEIQSVLTAPKGYRLWSTKPKYPSTATELRHKSRNIQEPPSLLRKIQDRLTELLVRIETPKYLFSAKKGCSYLSNADSHTGNSGQAIRIDIKGFYQNASDKYVRRFFIEDLQCSSDIAHILTEIICWNGCLPTGSPVSPIISYFANRPMFDELHALALSVGAVMTVYVDDIVFSGDGVNGSLIPIAKKIIKKSGLQGHKISRFRKNQPRIITGVAVMPNGQLRIPNKRHRKIRALQHEYSNATDPRHREIYYKALIGQYREGSRLEPNFLVKAKQLENQAIQKDSRGAS
ncbi:MAG: reverse transcriptase family protein [Proteobacteria bacterium]|nr:reverse transcriptase family protein [Pseudomonadota bacterium]